MERVGILGGTFNPPHAGHLALARDARAQLGLDRVLLVPANIAPNKPPSGEDPGAQHRLAMCRLAVAAEQRIQASALEVERGGVSYTVDTLELIHAEQPDALLTLILGADTARTLPGWREPERLLSLAGLAVADRDELTAAQIGAGIQTLQMEKVAVSSSQVRELVAAGLPVDELVGPAVAMYIAEHGLYRGRLAAEAPSGEVAA